MFGSKKGKAVAIENEVSSLQERQRETEWDLIVASGSLENAKQKHRRALVEPDSELSSAEAEKEVTAAEAQVAAIARRLEDIKGWIQDAETRLAVFSRRSEQERLSRDLESRAALIDKAAGQFTKAMISAQSEYNELVTALQNNGAQFGYRDAQAVARAALLETVDRFEPGLVRLMGYERHFLNGRDASEEVKAEITDQMRALSADIAAGKEPAEPGSLRPEMPDFRPTLPTVQVFFKRPVTYVDEHGVERRHAAWAQEVVEPLANAAVAAGLAVRLDSEVGEQAFERFRSQRRSGPKVSRGSNVSYFKDELVKIDIDLPAFLEKERERMRAEWLVAQQAAK